MDLNGNKISIEPSVRSNKVETYLMTNVTGKPDGDGRQHLSDMPRVWTKVQQEAQKDRRERSALTFENRYKS